VTFLGHCLHLRHKRLTNTHIAAGGFVGNVLLWLMCPQWGLCKQCYAQLFQKLIFMSDSVSYSKPSTMLAMISPMGPIANTHIYTDTLIYVQRNTHGYDYRIHKHNSTQTLPRCNDSTWVLIHLHIGIETSALQKVKQFSLLEKFDLRDQEIHFNQFWGPLDCTTALYSLWSLLFLHLDLSRAILTWNVFKFRNILNG